jgi:hypothetical protein
MFVIYIMDLINTRKMGHFKIHNFNSDNLNIERCVKIVVTQDFIIVTD